MMLRRLITGSRSQVRNDRIKPSAKDVKFFSTSGDANSRLHFSKMFEGLVAEDKPSAAAVSRCKSQRLMLYNGLMAPSHTGAYHLLPMGLRSLNKLKKVIQEAMRTVGAQEVSLSTISSGDLWKKSERWETTGSELFKLQDRHNIDYCLGPTYEEVITALVAANPIVSHKMLPISLYQITRKFRDEMAPKYGLLRGREFEMKDLYTFDKDEDSAKITYDKICQAYEHLFDRLNLKYVKVVGATGNIGGTLSHEYHIPADMGEDIILLCNNCGYSSNEELINTIDHACPKCECKMSKSNGIEIGHSFLLGTKYSKIFSATFRNSQQKTTLMEMGCYGIGVTRLIAAGIEVLSTEKQIRWPRLLAPYQVCIIPQKDGHKSDITFALSEKLYDGLQTENHLHNEVVIDDRTKFSIGKRMNQASVLGYPYIICVGKQALEDEPLFEVIDVYNDETSFLPESELYKKLGDVEFISV